MKQKQDKILRRLVLETRPIWKWLALACLLCIGLISCAVIGSSGRKQPSPSP